MPPWRIRSSSSRPDRVVRDRGDERRAEPEAAAQAAGDVVLAAALPDLEAAGGADARVSRIQAQHHLAERDEVEAAFLGWPDGEDGSRLLLGAEHATASRAKPLDLVEASRAQQRGRDHPAAADGATDGSAR